MKEQFNRYLTEHIIYLLQLLQTNHMNPGQILSSNKQADIGFLSPEDIQELGTACAAMEEMPGGVLLCRTDDSMQILYANQELLHIFQCDSINDFQEFTENSFLGMIHPDDLDMAREKIHAQKKDGHSRPDCMTYKARCKDGSVRWIENHSRYIRCENTEDIFCAFIGDATARQKQHQQQLSEALDKANMAAVAKNVFLTNISHDIRTPLNAIFGFTSLAKNSLEDTETLLDYLNRVETASKKLLDMLSNVLEVTALSTSDELAEAECSLCAISQQVYDFLRPHAQEKSITYTLDYSNVKHSGIYADEEKLKQIMLNLINNAITYTEPGGSVSITITEGDKLSGQESVFYIIVKDTGIGISDTFINHIFEPFSREQNSTLSGVHSIGLGLTIVKSIVDKMGGTIDAKSTVNEGSTFTVSLRLHTQTLTVSDSKEEQTEPPKQTILLVEDNEINREIEAELLERMNFVVVPVEDGQAALHKIEQASPGEYDLVLMDLQMPVMDGWQTAAAIRKLPDPALAEIPIIALSASIFLKDYQKSEESGINAHLAKPMNLPVLMDTIEKLTKNH